jgi:hypothetical protein
MRNVRLHLEPDIILDVRRLGGEMVSVHPGQPPVFDRPDSYVLRVADGDVAMDMDSLTVLMNRHVWNYKGSPLSNVRLSVEGGDVIQRATLHKGVKLPVVLKAAVSTSSDGRLRLHTEAVRALGVPATPLLKLFGLSVEDMVSLERNHGVQIDDNDVLVDPGSVVPPPRMEGRLTAVAVDGGVLRQRFGPAVRDEDASEHAARGYIHFTGATLRFGKLTMSDADLMLIDADARDPFDFYPAEYLKQLVRGYSKNTESGGLRTYMPDFEDLGRAPDLRPAQGRPAAKPAGMSGR